VICPQANQGRTPSDGRRDGGINDGVLPWRARRGPGNAGLCPAFDAAAFHDLLAEFNTQFTLGMPGDGAQAESCFAIKAQPEQRRQALWLGKFHQGPVLRYVTHGAVQVFGLKRMKYRGLHKGCAPRGAALFNALKVVHHWLTAPELSKAASLGAKPQIEFAKFTKIVRIVGGALPSRSMVRLDLTTQTFNICAA
jgi:hypothetical protein